MQWIQAIFDIFGIQFTDLPRYILFIIVFGLLIWFLFKKQFDPFKKSVNHIETYILKLSTFLSARPEIPSGTPEFNPFLNVSSPIRLQNVAEQILKDSGSDTLLINEKKTLFKEMASTSELRTALDVQIAARSAILSHQNDASFDQVKLFAYQYPVYKNDESKEFKVDYHALIGIMSIRLRDMYLIDHPTIPSAVSDLEMRDDEVVKSIFGDDVSEYTHDSEKGRDENN